MLINKALKYVDKQINDYAHIGDQLINSQTGEKFYTRGLFLKLDKYYRDFLRGNYSTRWIAILGLRGVGKTTLMQQLFERIKCPKQCKLFISVDDIKEEGLSLRMILNAYEERIGITYSQLTHPVYIFIDECHYDSNWTNTVKTLFDKNRMIFIVTTGSSAYSLNKSLTTDASRRIHQEYLYPMSFTEYISMLTGIKPMPNLMQELRDLIYGENDTTTIFNEMKKLEPEIRNYYVQLPKDSYTQWVEKYITQGNMPYCINLNQQDAHRRTTTIIKQVITKDFPTFVGIHKSTLGKVGDILHVMSYSLMQSEDNLSKNLGVNKATIRKMLESFREASILKRIYPYSSNKSQITKSSKYLFVSSVYRDTLLNSPDIPSNVRYEDIKGYMLEDIVQLYLSILPQQSASFRIRTYCDTLTDGVDFILEYESNLLAIEVGWAKTNPKQANRTLEYHKRCNKGLLISDTPLKIYDNNIINIPLSDFLLTA